MKDPAREEESPPDGFVRMEPFGPFHDLVGPMYYSAASPATVLGLRVDQRHRNRNATPMVHGGMIAVFVDTACTWAARHSQDQTISVLTTNLNVSLVGNAGPGEWIEAHVDIIRTGKRIVFTDCHLWCRGRRIAQASAQFHVLGESPADYPTFRHER